MSTAAETPARTAVTTEVPASQRWRGRSLLLGRLLTTAWLVFAGYLLAVGYVEGDDSDLRRVLEDGGSDLTVDMTPWGDSPMASGSSEEVWVQWRDGAVNRRVIVAQARDDAEARRVLKQPDVDLVVVGDFHQWLAREHPGVGASEANLRRSSGSIGNWHVSGWAFGAFFALWLTTWALVLHGPQPWRGTRYGWGWVVFLAPLPLGVPAYLLVGGPTGLFRPADPHRPVLTGGLGFLLVLAMPAVSAALAALLV